MIIELKETEFSNKTALLKELPGFLSEFGYKFKDVAEEFSLEGVVTIKNCYVTHNQD